MEDKLSQSDKVKEKPKKRWEKSTRIGDDENRTTVRQIENGYIVNKYRSWKDNDGWHSEDEEVFSKDNPLEKDDEASDKPSIKAIYENLFGTGTNLTD